MKIITIAAGAGTRMSPNFLSDPEHPGTRFPKALFPVLGKPMVYWALKSFNHWITTGVIRKEDLHFVIQKKHNLSYKVSERLQESFGPEIKVNIINDLTQGPAESALYAMSGISKHEDIVINDCDHFFHGEALLNLIEERKKMDSPKDFLLVAAVSTTPGIPSWSYVRTEKINGLVAQRVVEIKEKDPELASMGALGVIGAYYFSSAELFMKLYLESFKNYNGEFFLSKMFQTALEQNIKVYSCQAKFGYPLGSPEDINEFERQYGNLRLSYLGLSFLVDIDGTLVIHDKGYHSNEGRYSTKLEIIEENAEQIRQHFYMSDKVILTTTRPSCEREQLVTLLKRANIPFHQLIMDLNPGVRVLINDRKDDLVSTDTSVAITQLRNSQFSTSNLQRSLGSEICKTLTRGSGSETLHLKNVYGCDFIRKVVPANEKYREQINVLNIQNDWYKAVMPTLTEAVPEVLHCGAVQSLYILDLSYVQNIGSLADLIFLRNSVAAFEPEIAIRSLLNELNNLYTTTATHDYLSGWSHQSVLLSIILNKALPGINSLLALKGFSNNELRNRKVIKLNDETVKNPILTLQTLIDNPKLLSKYRLGLNTKFNTLIHGDLTLENILIKPDFQVSLIDPLSSFMDPMIPRANIGELGRTSPMFDLIKLLQSLDSGYEIWTQSSRCAFQDIDGSIHWRNELQPEGSPIKDSLIEFYSELGANTARHNLDFLLALQLFRLIPYKISQNIDQAWYCFAQGSHFLHRSIS